METRVRGMVSGSRGALFLMGPCTQNTIYFGFKVVSIYRHFGGNVSSTVDDTHPALP